MTQNNFKIYANHEFSVAYPPGWNVEQLDSGVAFSTEGASQYARIQILQNLNGAKTLDDYLGDNEKVKQEAAKRGSKILSDSSVKIQGVTGRKLVEKIGADNTKIEESVFFAKDGKNFSFFSRSFEKDSEKAKPVFDQIFSSVENNPPGEESPKKPLMEFKPMALKAAVGVGALVAFVTFSTGLLGLAKTGFAMPTASMAIAMTLFGIGYAFVLWEVWKLNPIARLIAGGVGMLLLFIVPIGSVLGIIQISCLWSMSAKELFPKKGLLS